MDVSDFLAAGGHKTQEGYVLIVDVCSDFSFFIVYCYWGIYAAEIKADKMLWEKKLYGQIVLDRDHDLYVGADCKTNNTAELTAMVEMCEFIEHVVQVKNPKKGTVFSIGSDSTYAWDTLMEIRNGPQHPLLVKTARNKWHRVKELLKEKGCYWRHKHIYSHTGHRGNEAADKLAEHARTSGATCDVYDRYWGQDHAVNLHPGISQNSEDGEELLCSPPDYTRRSYEGADVVMRLGEDMADNGNEMARGNLGTSSSSSSEPISADLLQSSVETVGRGTTSRVRPAVGFYAKLNKGNQHLEATVKCANEMLGVDTGEPARDDIQLPTDGMLEGEISEVEYDCNIGGAVKEDVMPHINDIIGSLQPVWFDAFPGLSSETRIIDLEFGEMGMLTALDTPKLRHTASLFPMAQKLWNDLMRNVIENPDDDLAIKKFSLFHRVLLTPTHGGILSTYNILQLIKDNNWDHFTLGIFKMKKVQPPPDGKGDDHSDAADSDEFSETEVAARVRRTVAHFQRGSVSKAGKAAMEQHSKVKDHALAFEAVEKLHPKGSQPNGREIEKAILNVRADDICGTDIKTAVTQFNVGASACQITALSNMHMKQMFLTNPSSRITHEICENMAVILNLYRAGMFPKEALAFFNSGQSIALAKSDGGTRPLGNTEFLRKLLVKITMLCAAADIRSVAKGMNSFLEKRGTENLVWTAKVALELGLGNHHLLFSDIQNAFNTVDRILALAYIHEELPMIYEAFHTIYSAYSDMWYNGKEGGPDAISSEVGSTQGCGTGGVVLFCATYGLCKEIGKIIEESDEDVEPETINFEWECDDDMDLARELDTLRSEPITSQRGQDVPRITPQLLHESPLVQQDSTQPQLLRLTEFPDRMDDRGRRVLHNHSSLKYGREYARWFADDGIAKARMAKILKILAAYGALGQKYGVKLSLTKTVIMLPPIMDPEELQRTIQAYLDVGLVKEKVLIHPFSYEVGSSEYLAAKAKYGVKYLGVFIGSAEFVLNKLRDKIKELELMALRLRSVALYEPHRAFYLLCSCFSKKAEYIQRMISPALMGSFNKAFDLMCRQIAEECLAAPLSDSAWRQMCLKKMHGGCGIGFQDDMATAGYVSSLEESMEYVLSVFPTLDGSLYTNEGRRRLIASRVDAFAQYTRLKQQVGSLDEEHHLRLLSKKNLQHKYSSIMDLERKECHFAELTALDDRESLARFHSLQCRVAVAWLEQIPKCKHTTLGSEEFRVALTIFLGEPIKFLPRVCSCKARCPIDSKGKHLLMCASGGGPTHRHDAIRDKVFAFASYAGLNAEKEPKSFITANPNDLKRADVLLECIGDGGKDLIVDVYCSHPGSDTNLSKNSSFTGMEDMIKDMESMKNSKYRKSIETISQSATYVPMACSVFGFVSKAFSRIIEKLSYIAAEVRGITVGAVRRSWVASFSLALYRANAKMVIAKRIAGKVSKNGCRDHELYNDFVMINSWHK